MLKIPESVWSIAQGTVDDRPMFVRINTAAQPLVGNTMLGHRIGVAVPFRFPDAQGLPGAGEHQPLQSIEDALCVAFGDRQAATLVLVITTSGMREFVFHTSDPHRADRNVPDVRARFPEYDVQFMIEEDPEWNAYQHFATTD